MRIVVLENRPSSYFGGQELSLVDVTQGLAEKGHEIIFLHVTDGDLLERYRKFSARVLRVGGGYSVSKTGRLRSALQFIGSVFSVPRGADTVVYANQYLDSLFAAALAAWQGCPFVCHLRLPPPDIFCGQYRLGISRANRLIAVSNKTRQDYVARGFKADAVDVVYNGIAADRFPLLKDRETARRDLGLPAGSFVVVYAGRMHPVKGVHDLIDAFAGLLRFHPDSRLVLSNQPGKPDEALDAYRKELEQRVVTLDLERKVHWIDHSKDVARLFGMSDAVVLPSVWSEPFGRVLIEAMACGVPALGSRVGGIPEILSESFSAFTFAPGSPDDLSRLLCSLVGWREKDASMAARCRAYVERQFPIYKTVDGVEISLSRALQDYRSGRRVPVVEGALR